MFFVSRRFSVPCARSSDFDFHGGTLIALTVACCQWNEPESLIHLFIHSLIHLFIRWSVERKKKKNSRVLQRMDMILWVQVRPVRARTLFRGKCLLRLPNKVRTMSPVIKWWHWDRSYKVWYVWLTRLATNFLVRVFNSRAVHIIKFLTWRACIRSRDPNPKAFFFFTLTSSQE